MTEMSAKGFHAPPNDQTPLLDGFSRASRTPLSPSNVEMSLYHDLAVGVDGKGARASTLWVAKTQTIFVLNCGIVAHLVVLLPQTFVFFVRRNALSSFLNILVLLSLLCFVTLNISEAYQLRAMRSPLTFRRNLQLAERTASLVIAALNVGASAWICVLALRNLHNAHFLLVFDQHDSILLLCLSLAVFITALGGFILVVVLLLPKYRALWDEQHHLRKQQRDGTVDYFGNFPSSNLRASTSAEAYVRKKPKSGCIAHTKWSIGIILIPVVMELLVSLGNAVFFLSALSRVEIPKLPAYYTGMLIMVNVVSPLLVVALLIPAWRST